MGEAPSGSRRHSRAPRLYKPLRSSHRRTAAEGSGRMGEAPSGSRGIRSHSRSAPRNHQLRDARRGGRLVPPSLTPIYLCPHPNAPRECHCRSTRARQQWAGSNEGPRGRAQYGRRGHTAGRAPACPRRGLGCREPQDDALIRPRSPVLDSVRDIKGFANRCRFRERRPHVYSRR
jgi:hypothetical protein